MRPGAHQTESVSGGHSWHVRGTGKADREIRRLFLSRHRRSGPRLLTCGNVPSGRFELPTTRFRSRLESCAENPSEANLCVNACHSLSASEVIRGARVPHLCHTNRPAPPVPIRATRVAQAEPVAEPSVLIAGHCSKALARGVDPGARQLVLRRGVCARLHQGPGLSVPRHHHEDSRFGGGTRRRNDDAAASSGGAASCRTGAPWPGRRMSTPLDAKSMIVLA